MLLRTIVSPTFQRKLLNRGCYNFPSMIYPYTKSSHSQIHHIYVIAMHSVLCVLHISESCPQIEATYSLSPALKLALIA